MSGRNGGKWTEGRYRSFITSTLRGGFRRWPPKFDVLKSAFVGKKTNKATGRIASHYKCAMCKKQFVATGVQVDHKDPVVDPATGFVSWDVFIERLFCEVDNLQVLCKGCHKLKTKEERCTTTATTTRKRTTGTRSRALKKSVKS